jgi:uncharacterized membrane protein YbjE (DUF340 family)
MIIMMILFTILGVVAAQFEILPQILVEYSGNITEYSLYLLLLIIGYDIGKDKNAVLRLITKDKFAFLVPEMQKIVWQFLPGLAGIRFQL